VCSEMCNSDRRRPPDLPRPRPRPRAREAVLRAAGDRLLWVRAGARLRVLAISRNFDAEPP
jgi:hypothetical protein